MGELSISLFFFVMDYSFIVFEKKIVQTFILSSEKCPNRTRNCAKVKEFIEHYLLIRNRENDCPKKKKEIERMMTITYCLPMRGCRIPRGRPGPRAQRIPAQGRK